jgi:hypothetical protein
MVGLNRLQRKSRGNPAFLFLEYGNRLDPLYQRERGGREGEIVVNPNDAE